jgi:hypothetical protein
MLQCFNLPPLDRKLIDPKLTHYRKLLPLVSADHILRLRLSGKPLPSPGRQEVRQRRSSVPAPETSPVFAIGPYGSLVVTPIRPHVLGYVVARRRYEIGSWQERAARAPLKR